MTNREKSLFSIILIFTKPCLYGIIILIEEILKKVGFSCVKNS